MKLTLILLAICVGLFVFVMTPYIQSGFVVKCGVEQAYALGVHHGKGGNHGKGGGESPGGGGGGNPAGGGENPRSVPEPSALILLGTGLAAVGSYYAIRLRKR